MNFEVRIADIFLGTMDWPKQVKKTNDIETGYHLVAPFGEDFGKFEATTYYDSTPLVFVIARGHEISFIERLLRPFDRRVWIWLIVLIIISAVAVLLVQKFAKVYLRKIVMGWHTTTPLWNLLNLVLNGTIVGSQMPRTNFARFAVFKLLIFFLVMRSAYTGALFGFVEKDIREEPIRKLSDVIEKKFTLYVSPRYDNKSLDEFDEIKKTYAKEDVGWILEQLVHNPGFKGIMALDLDIVLHRNNYNILRGKPLLHFFPETLYNKFRVVALKRNSPLRRKFTNYILRFQEAGLFVCWKRKYIPKIKASKIPPEKLKLHKIIGLVKILLVGYTLGIIAFIFERSTKLQKYCKSKLNIFK